MHRIVVVGCSGSGKSTLARELGRRLGLPVIHLDVLYWQSGWKPPPDRSAFDAQVLEITARDRWIIDGGFTTGTIEQRLGRADAVVLMDFPSLLCAWRAVSRVFKYWRRVRPDLAPGCYEKFDLAFYLYIWTYRRHRLPKLEAEIAQYFGGRLFRLKGPQDVDAFLATVPIVAATV